MPRRTYGSRSSTLYPTHSFFILPPEIRQEIYQLLLRSSSDIYIPQSAFKRRKNPSTSLNQFRCPCRRNRRHRRWPSSQSPPCRPSGSGSLPSHPLLSKAIRSHEIDSIVSNKQRSPIDLLRTCRIVYREASPIIYRENVFHFENAHTAHAFRWSSPFAIHVKKVHIILSPIYRDHDNRSHHRADASWSPYLNAQRFDFASDFPNLDHVTITLGRGLEVAKLSKLQEMLFTFQQCLRVRIFEIVGVNNKKILPGLSAIVRPQDRNSKQRYETHKVQTSISEHKEMVGWTNGIMWWGKDGEEAPVKPRTFVGDCRYRRRLYSIDSSSPVDSYMGVGESFLPGTPL